MPFDIKNMNSLIIIPTYKERPVLGNTLNQIFDTMPEGHVLVVDDDSPDGTPKLVHNLINTAPFGDRLLLMNRKNERGYASACCDGLDYFIRGRWDYVQLMDADGSQPVNLLPHFRQKLQEGADMVIGTRYLEGGGSKDMPITRLVIEQIEQQYLKTLLGNQFSDWGSSFVAMRRELVDKINYRNIIAGGFAFQIELKDQARAQTDKVVEIPMLFQHRKNHRTKLSNRMILEVMSIPLRLKLNHVLRRIL